MCRGILGDALAIYLLIILLILTLLIHGLLYNTIPKKNQLKEIRNYLQYGSNATKNNTNTTVQLQNYFIKIITRCNFPVKKLKLESLKESPKARFKRRILHAPNRIAKLTACKMRRLNQLNATHFNSMRVSRIFD